MSAARKPSAASIERALVEWHRAEAAVTWDEQDQRKLTRWIKAHTKVETLAARLAGRRGK
jgi:hypothetical protein